MFNVEPAKFREWVMRSPGLHGEVWFDDEEDEVIEFPYDNVIRYLKHEPYVAANLTDTKWIEPEDRLRLEIP